jgi:hypothetical protein
MAKKSTSPVTPNTNGSASVGKPEGESISGYFRKVFEENPKFLTSRSNDELLKRWLADHPGEKEVPKNVKANLSNLKSVMRSKGRKKKAKAAIAAASVPGAKKIASLTHHSKSKLELLEEQIDESLTAARFLDKEGLADVILHLRKARNAVVWKMGQ